MKSVWIELHESFRDHPKIKRLAARLNIERPLAKGYMINLWLWSSKYAQDGDLTRFSPIEIADACESTIDPTLLQNILIECKFLDFDNGNLKIHHWKEHGIRLLKDSRKRQAKHRKEKGLREQLSSVSVTSPLRDENVTDASFFSILSILSIPSNHVLYSDEFKKLWVEWIEHRKEKKKSLTLTTMKFQLRKLAVIKDPVAALEQSLEKGWLGIFESGKVAEAEAKAGIEKLFSSQKSFR